jgi:hypothetical protein
MAKGRVSVPCRSCDLIQYRIGIAQHLIIPESQYPIPQALQVQSPQPVGMLLRRFKMLASIQFNDQPDFQADEIQVERPDPMLPPEFAFI